MNISFMQNQAPVLSQKMPGLSQRMDELCRRTEYLKERAIGLSCRVSGNVAGTPSNGQKDTAFIPLLQVPELIAGNLDILEKALFEIEEKLF